MAFDRLLDNCQALEKTISILIRSNSNKQQELIRLQNSIFDESQASLDEILQRESAFQKKLDNLKLQKNDLDTEIKQYSETNEKLSDLVTIVQKSNHSEDEDNDCKNDEMSLAVIDTLEDYNQVKQECEKVMAKVSHLVENIEKDKTDIKNFITEKQVIVNELHRNDANIRLYEQQNKFAEQQFDLIINQLPWEPLTEHYIDNLRKSSVSTIRDIAETLQLQKNEIEELTESLNAKKAKKLRVLEELHCELNSFLQKREEAALITRALEV